jgi:hypothetical protein
VRDQKLYIFVAGIAAVLLFVRWCPERGPQGGKTGDCNEPPKPKPLWAARPCRADVFAIDVPIWASPTWRAPDVVPNIAIELNRDVSRVRSWFCGPGQTNECAPGGRTIITATVTSVLPRRDAPEWRRDGDKRFFRLRFVNGARQALKARADALPDLVRTLREVFPAVVHAGQIPLHVHRECEGGSAAPYFDNGLLDSAENWYKDRLGIPTAPLPASSNPLVDIALIDTGVDQRLAASLGVVRFGSAPSGLLHPHGTAMAIFLHDVAPSARIHDIQALDENGNGSIEAVAQAIDHALFDLSPTDPSRPLVLNLSLGWPPELGERGALYSPTSTTVEDPAGEAVRYLLDGARRDNDAGRRTILVSAAAGNRPGRLLPAVRDKIFPAPPTSVPIEPPCGTDPYQAAGGSPWFYPAEWTHRASCSSAIPNAKPVKPAFGVAAVDEREIPIALAIQNGEAPLVAPGEHVYANSTAVSSPNMTPVCNGAFSFPQTIAFPMSFTGTSVSTAFVSGAAARTQAALKAAGQAPLDWDGVARLLYMTGVDVRPLSDLAPHPSQFSPRLTPDKIAVRRLSIKRLDAALSCAALSNLLTCVRGVSPNRPPIDGTSNQDCVPQLRACGIAPEIAADSPMVPNPVSQPSTPAFTSYHDQMTCGGLTLNMPITPIDASWCSATGCPYEQVPNRVNLGGIGPQPGDPGCPDCTHQSPLRLELSSLFRTTTYFKDAYLVFSGPRKSAPQQTKTYYVDLASLNGAPLMPGEWLTINGIRLDTLDLAWEKTTESLIMTTNAPPFGATQQPGADYSPIRVHW